jgi:hypothetical protein
MDAPMWIIAGIGALTMAGVYLGMKNGLLPANRGIVGLVFVVTLIVLLGLRMTQP